MNKLNLFEKLAFTAAKNIIEHIETVINEYMQKNNITLEQWQENGSYAEIETLEGRSAIISYNEIPFHKFEYDFFGSIIKTWNK